MCFHYLFLSWGHFRITLKLSGFAKFIFPIRKSNIDKNWFDVAVVAVEKKMK